MQTKLICTEPNHDSDTQLGYAVRVEEKACNACMRASGIESIQIALQPCLFYNEGTLMYKNIGSRKAGYALQLQRACYAGSDRVMLQSETGDGAVAQEELDRSDAVHKPLASIESAMFSPLHTMVENSQLYVLRDEELSDGLEVKSVSGKQECLH